MAPPLATKRLERYTMAYRELGRGPALVMLHGIGSNSAAWAEQFDVFAQEFQVIAWDMPGYGGSDDLVEEAPSVTAYADVLKQLLDALEVKRLLLLGHSLGGLIATAYAARHRNLVTSLVLANTAQGHGRLSEEERQARLAARLDDLRRFGPAGMARRRAPKLLSADATEAACQAVERAMARVRPNGYAQAARMLSNGDIFAYTERLDMPTLVMCGTEDAVTPEETNREVAEAIGRAQYVPLPGVGHSSQIEDPETFNDIVLSFLLGRARRT